MIAASIRHNTFGVFTSLVGLLSAAVLFFYSPAIQSVKKEAAPRNKSEDAIRPPSYNFVTREYFRKAKSISVDEIYNEGDGNYYFKAKYPQFDTERNPELELINRDIKSNIEEIWENSSYRLETDPSLDSLEAEVPYDDELANADGSSVEIEYKIRAFSESLVVIERWYSEYSGHIRHNIDIDTVHVRLKNYRRLTLDDVFDKVSYVLLTEKVSEYLKNAIGEEGNWIGDGVYEAPECFNSFILKEDSIEFIYSPYVVSSWAMGVVRVTIPFEELAPVMNLKPGIAEILKKVNS